MDAETFEITDGNGLNRFKSGFLVDAFQGHRVGDVRHLDYKCSIDMENQILRPSNTAENIPLIESNTTDSQRTTAGYQRTGDLITLPYTEVVASSQIYATRQTRINPSSSGTFLGILALTPSGDNWFETQKAPDIIINVDGNFDSVFAKNKHAIGTIWNAWQTQWSGAPKKSSREHERGRD